MVTIVITMVAGQQAMAEEGTLSPALALTLPESGLMNGIVAELIPSDSGLIVYRISVYDPMLRTSKGIGVESTVAQLGANYDLDAIW
jgi:hypothetical protein